MKKYIPYLIICVLIAVIVYRCDPSPPVATVDTHQRDSLIAIAQDLQRKYTADTLDRADLLRAKDSVVRVWRSRYRHQKAKTVVVTIREQVPEIDSAFTACDSLDSALNNQVGYLRSELYKAEKFALQSTIVLNQADTASQEVIVSLRSQNETLRQKNRRLSRSNRRLWMGNGVQAVLHLLRSVE